MSERPALDRWRDQLADWAIPDWISEQAPAFPWTLDPALFRPAQRVQSEGSGDDSLPDDNTVPDDGTATESLSTARASEALPVGGSVLDVGCGGGAATMALGDAVGSACGVDESADMTELFLEVAAERGIDATAVVGRWPDVASSVPRSDVVVCHHVAFNVSDLASFGLALHRAVRPGGRVVMELTTSHPQTVNAPLWRHFWDVERPSGPTAAEAADVLLEAGLSVTLETGPAGALRREAPWDARVAGAARMLCLGPDRADEVAAQLEALPPRSTERAVIWWDVE